MNGVSVEEITIEATENGLLRVRRVGAGGRGAESWQPGGRKVLSAAGGRLSIRENLDSSLRQEAGSKERMQISLQVPGRAQEAKEFLSDGFCFLC